MANQTQDMPLVLSLMIWATLLTITYIESVAEPADNILGRLSRRYLPLQWFAVWTWLGFLLLIRRLVPAATPFCQIASNIDPLLE